MSGGRAAQGRGGSGRTFAVTLVAAVCVLASLPGGAFAVPPTIPLTAISAVGTSAATLEADVNPEGKAILYRFEYGLADCASSPCTSVPVPDGELPSGAVPVRVTETIEGLSPGTAYHFRLLAENGAKEKAQSPDRVFTTYLLSPVFGPCSSNEALRKGPTGDAPSLGLPDCRAYEQASPTAKNGTSLLGEVVALRAAPAGDAVSFESSSGIPGGEGGQNFPYYLSSRGAESWSTQGLLPKAAAAEGAEVTGWTKDFEWSFARARIGNATAYMARSSADGSLTPIVDYLPEAGLEPRFAGASEDGSKVFFESPAEIPGQPSAPEKPNLYAWDRGSEELSLAGVLPDGSTPPGGSFAGPYDWIQGTTKETVASGGASDNYYTQDTNAVSADGSRVFFTEGETGQLYLREDPTEEGAATVQVSKSLKDNGKGPGGTDSAGTRPAAFQAASADGSVAFLTSSEKLTNDATTGVEPETFPAIASANITTKPPTDIKLGCLPTAAFGVALDSEHIYWTDPGAGTISMAELDCKDPEKLIEGLESPQGLAVDAEHIYWSELGELDEETGKALEGKGTIGRAEIDGESPNPDFITGASNPQGVAVNATHVFWANAFRFNPGFGSKGTIGRAELSASEAKDVDQDFIEMPLTLEHPEGVAVSGEHIYWTASRSNLPVGFVRMRELDGDPESEEFILIGEKLELAGIAVNASHVYWSSPAPQNAIGRAKLDLTEVEKEFITGAGQPQGLAVNATHAYWAANQVTQPNPGNDLYRFDAEAPPAERLTDLVVDTSSANGAEVRGVIGASGDGSHLYFAANGDLDGTGPASDGDCQGKIVIGSGQCNLYLWREDGSAKGEITFVARLQSEENEESDGANWAATPNGISGSFSLTFQKTARLSPDGRTLIFRSQRQLGAYENAGVPQFYRYDADEESVTCVSCNPSGEAPGAPPSLGGAIAFLISAGTPAATLTRNLSAGGERVFFESTERLVAEDTNGLAGCPVVGSANQSFRACNDLYMWEASGAGSCESEAQNGGCLYLLSTGKSPEPSFFADAGASGADAFLLTSSRLVPQDRDELYDVYDARVQGGLTAQNQPPSLICTSVDACHELPKPPPSTESPASVNPGPPDPLPTRKKACPKGKRKAMVKGKARCVGKRHKGKRAAGKRRARDKQTSRRVGR